MNYMNYVLLLKKIIKKINNINVKGGYYGNIN